MRATSTALRSPEAHLALTFDRPNYCEQALLKWADVRGMFRGKSTLVRFADDGAPRTARRGGDDVRPTLSSLAAQEMRAGPSDSDCRIRVQTTASCSGTTALVLSVAEKAGVNPSGVRW